MASSLDRFRAALESARLGRAARRVRLLERKALRDLGAGIPNAPRAGPLADVALRRKALEEARAAVTASLVADRTDYAMVRAFARPAVILRGIAHRIVLREHVRKRSVDCDAASERLGAAALDLGIDAPAAERIRSLRAEAESLEARRKKLIERHGDSPVPALLSRAASETAGMGKALVGLAVPRLPALLAVVLVWWVVSALTGSPLSATLHSWGFAESPDRFVSPEIYDAMRFWLPLSAAAICAYGLSRVAAIVRARYRAEAPAHPRTPPAA
jgi:hypothetical protein